MLDFFKRCRYEKPCWLTRGADPTTVSHGPEASHRGRGHVTRGCSCLMASSKLTTCSKMAYGLSKGASRARDALARGDIPRPLGALGPECSITPEPTFYGLVRETVLALPPIVTTMGGALHPQALEGPSPSERPRDM